MKIRTLFTVSVLFAAVAATSQAFACGYRNSATMGSNTCTGGEGAGDRQTMNDIRAAIAAQRAQAAQEQANRQQQR